MSIFVAVDEAVVMNVDVAVVMTVDEAVGNDAVVMAVDEPFVMSIDEAGVVDNGQDVVGGNDREDVVGSNNREDVVGNDLSRSYGKGGHVLHIGDHLVGEVGLHALDAGHVQAVGTVAVGGMGKTVDVAVGDMGKTVAVAVEVANVARHGATNADESSNDALHV